MEEHHLPRSGRLGEADRVVRAGMPEVREIRQFGGCVLGVVDQHVDPGGEGQRGGVQFADA